MNVSFISLILHKNLGVLVIVIHRFLTRAKSNIQGVCNNSQSRKFGIHIFLVMMLDKFGEGSDYSQSFGTISRKYHFSKIFERHMYGNIWLCKEFSKNASYWAFPEAYWLL